MPDHILVEPFLMYAFQVTPTGIALHTSIGVAFSVSPIDSNPERLEAKLWA